MIENSKISLKLKGEIITFCENISDGLTKPERKALIQMIFGIIEKGSCHVNEICRSTDQDIRLKKLVERVIRHISKDDFGILIQKNYLDKIKKRIKKDTIISVDYTALVKKYAKKQDNLCKVRDGRTNSIKTGFWQIEVCAVDIERKQYLPLYSKLHSQEQESFKSENSETFATIEFLKESFGDKGVYVFDRGFDRNVIFAKLLELESEFIVRLKSNRHLLFGKKGQKKSAENVANSVRCQVRELVKLRKKDKTQVFELDYGSRKVRLPNCPEVELNLVVIKGKRGDVKAMFLTSLECASRKNLNKVVKSYFARWAVEEIIRFRKQEFDLENIRLRSWTRLQNMTTLVLLAGAFVAMKASLSLSGRTILKILDLSKRAGRLKKFILYAVRYGISVLLSLRNLKFRNQRKTDTDQLSFFKTINPIGDF